MGYLKNGEKRLYLEAMAAMALFFAAGWLRRTTIPSLTDPALLLSVKFLPLLPILLIGIAVWRFYRRSDELERLTILKTAAVASLLSIIVFIGWSVLQPVGLPLLTGQTAVLILCGCYAVSGASIKFLEGRADAGTKQAFIRLAPLLFMLVFALALVLTLNRLLPAQSMPTLRGVVGLGAMAVMLCIYWLLKRRLDS